MEEKILLRWLSAQKIVANSLTLAVTLESRKFQKENSKSQNVRNWNLEFNYWNLIIVSETFELIDIASPVLIDFHIHFDMDLLAEEFL